MKIVPADAVVLPNAAWVQKNLLKLKPIMSALSKTDIQRPKLAAKPTPKGRRSKSAPTKLPNVAALAFQNVTMRRMRRIAKVDRGQRASTKPCRMPSEEAAEGTTKRETRRRSNTVDVAPAANIGLQLGKSLALHTTSLST